MRSLIGVVWLFLLAYSFSQHSNELLPGIPIRGSVNSSQYDYYKVSLGSHSQTLTIACTPLGDGDPDLFVSLQTEFPTSSTAGVFAARSYGSDAITIPSSEYNNVSFAYVSVFGWRNANYTITASFESVVQLIEGVPQAGLVPKEGMDYYQITIPNIQTHSELTVTATPTRGDIMVYISTTGPPEHANFSSYQWTSSIHYQGEAIVIRSSDAGWPTQSGNFWIGIYGLTNSTYSVVAAGNFTNIHLRAGIPQSDHCETGQTEYFQLDITNSGCNLTITVTPISGDPDLFVSNTTQYPKSGNAVWQSLAYGADKVTINHAQAGTYYIGISAWRNATFTVLADLNCAQSGNTSDKPIVLVNGSPQEGSLNTGDEKYYRFQVQDGHEDITITVTRRYGDPDLYIRNDGGKPTPQNYTWKSINYGEDVLTIQSSDRHACTNCYYDIGVFASSNCSYTISATTSDHIIRLQEGVPVSEDLVQNHFEYFRFNVEALEEFTVTVTPLGHGDPDLYISANASILPNQTQYDWAAQRLYGDSITIPYSDPKACQFCTYWIGVYAFSNTSFTIVARFNHTIRLQDGVPQSGSVQRGAFAYYDFQTQGDKDVTIVLTTLNGTSSLYLTTGNKLPETNYYQWYQPFYNQLKSITVSPTDANACHDSSCYYHIGVYGVENSTYTIVASVAGTNETGRAISLINGVAQRAQLETGDWQYFSIAVEETGKDLSIVVTTINGDADLYVSRNNSHPTTTEYEKKSIRYGSDSVDYENAPVATYYIGIRAYSNTTFNILALITPSGGNCTDRSCVIPLFNGQPQEGVIHVAQYVYYSFDVVSPQSQLTFTLTKQYGDPDLYISANGTFPTRTSFEWSSASIQADSVVIDSPRIGHYIIGVYAYQTSGYTLTVSAVAQSSNVSTTLITLQNGVPLRGLGSAHQYQYYVLPVDSTGTEDFTVTVTPFSGDPDLYVSTNSSHPNSTNYIWSAAAYSSDSITVPTTHPSYCRCPYYIAVYSYTASSYTIVASYIDTQNLADGQPQQGQVAIHAFVYYRLLVASAHTDLTITLTPRDGNPDLYVSLNTKPTLTNATWKAVDQYTTSSVVIRSNDRNACSSNCVYYIGIYGSEASNFTIAASTGGQSNLLQNGVPKRDWVDTNTWEYFSFDVTTAGQDVTITLTPLSGDPDLYVSHVNPRPNLTDYEYSSRQQGSDAVGIIASNATTWYIGVYAYTNSSFTVTAYIHCGQCPPLMLVNGIPQSGVLNKGEYQYYRFWLTSDNRSDELSITVTNSW